VGTNGRKVGGALEGMVKQLELKWEPMEEKWEEWLSK
jgi:hypothetical protein